MSRRITNVGELQISSNNVYWKIPNFYYKPQEVDSIIESYRFPFKGIDWKLYVYPNGSMNTAGWLEILAIPCKYTDRSTFKPGRLSIISESQEYIVISQVKEFTGLYSTKKLISREYLDSQKDYMVPGGHLHLLFEIMEENDDFETDSSTQIKEYDVDESFKDEPLNVEASVQTEIIEKSFEDEPLNVESSSQTEIIEKQFKDESRNVGIEVSTQTEIKKWFKDELGKAGAEASTQTESVQEKFEDQSADTCKEVSTQTEVEIGMKKLNQDLKEILLNGDFSDVLLKIEDQESRAHRCILATRSPAFLAVLMHESKEQITGVIDIEDIDSSTFPDFIRYLLTGRLENLTLENAIKLYRIADKYQINELIKNCMEHMLANISIDNFCDVFVLTHRHDNQDLREACIRFFSANSLDIITSSKWKTFLAENFEIGNELLIKYVELRN